MPASLCGTIRAGVVIHRLSPVMRQFRTRAGERLRKFSRMVAASLGSQPAIAVSVPPLWCHLNGRGRGVGNQWSSLVVAERFGADVLNESAPAMEIGGTLPLLGSNVVFGTQPSRRVTFLLPARLT